MTPRSTTAVEGSPTEGNDPGRTEAERAAAERVTVVVPARNEEQWIGRCLDSILAQDHRDLQVIVVDGASTDDTARIVAGYAELDPRVQMIENPARSIPRSLNLALNAATSRFIVRVDAHSTIPPDYVARALAHLIGGTWGGVGGRKDGVGVSRSGQAIALSLASPFGVGDSVYHHGTEPQVVDHIPFGAYVASAVREVGGWDERLAVNEDYEMDLRLRRAGYRLLFDPDLRIAWGSRQTVSELFAQYHRYGRGKADVAKLHPDSLSARHLAAPALVAAIVAGLVLLARDRRPMAALAALYGAAAGVAVARAARTERDPRILARMPPAFIAMHVGWGIGFWQGLVSRKPGRTNASG